jgi:hypothetical protein
VERINRILVQAAMGINRSCLKKIPKTKRARGVAQVVEHMPGNPSPLQKKKKILLPTFF